MLQQDVPDDYIIASGGTRSVQDLVECAFDYVGLNWEKYVSVDPAFYRPNETVQLVGSIEKIRSNLSWQPDYSFERLVQSMVDHDLKVLS